MTMRGSEEDSLIQYLVGEMTAAECEELEARYFVDGDLLEQLLAVEENLLDDYARGRLAPNIREQVERRLLLSPRRRESLDFSQDLQLFFSSQEDTSPASASAIIESQTPTQSWWRSVLTQFGVWSPASRLIFAASLILLLLGGVWLTFHFRRGESQIAQTLPVISPPISSPIPIEQAQNPPGQLPVQHAQGDLRSSKPSEQSKPGVNSSRISHPSVNKAPQPHAGDQNNVPTANALLTLMPARSRGGAGARALIIPREAKFVRFNLALEQSAYNSYRVELQTAEGVTLWRTKELRARRSNSADGIMLTVPANFFAVKGDYIFSLKGTTGGAHDDLSDYYFLLEKR